jgi:hypothetical protein
MAHDHFIFVPDEREADRHDASIRFGRRASRVHVLEPKVDLVTRAERMMEAHLVVTERGDHSMFGEFVNETLLESKDEHARCGRSAAAGRNLAIDVDRKWVPTLREIHQLVTINDNDRTRHALTDDNVLEADHLLTSETDNADGRILPRRRLPPRRR